MEYQKINTLFKRDEKGIIIPEEFTLPEFGWLKNCKWEATEKIDGTNMRLELQFSTDDYNPEVLNYTCRICGKTAALTIYPGRSRRVPGIKKHSIISIVSNVYTAGINRDRRGILQTCCGNPAIVCDRSCKATGLTVNPEGRSRGPCRTYQFTVQSVIIGNPVAVDI